MEMKLNPPIHPATASPLPRLRILPATAADASTILLIQQQAFAAEARLCKDFQIPPLTESVDMVHEHIKHATVLTAWDGERLAGSIRGLSSGEVCTVRALSIDPELQGKGIGSRLLAAIEQAHPKVARFELLTNVIMESNVRFYLRHGYQVTEKRIHSDKITLAFMTKPGVTLA